MGAVIIKLPKCGHHGTKVLFEIETMSGRVKKVNACPACGLLILHQLQRAFSPALIDAHYDNQQRLNI